MNSARLLIMDIFRTPSKIVTGQDDMAKGAKLYCALSSCSRGWGISLCANMHMLTCPPENEHEPIGIWLSWKTRMDKKVFAPPHQRNAVHFTSCAFRNMYKWQFDRQFEVFLHPSLCYYCAGFLKRSSAVSRFRKEEEWKKDSFTKFIVLPYLESFVFVNEVLIALWTNFNWFRRIRYKTLPCMEIKFIDGKVAWEGK